MRALAVLVAAAALGGCATGYQSGKWSYTGGYREAPAPGPLVKVVFHGNGFIDSATVQKYALYRCAEVAKERKAAYFVLYETLGAASIGRAAELPTVGSVGNKPTAFAFVLFLDKPRPNAKDTEKTLLELDEVVRKGKPQT